MKSNIEKLGDTLNKRMQSVYRANSGVVAETGTITANLSLQLASLKNTIPKGDYWISRDLAYGAQGATLVESKSTAGGSGEASFASHSHTVPVPASMQSLKSGDKVLVIWCGNEPIVTAILVAS